MNYPPTTGWHRRILVIDDNRSIHEDFRKVLGKRGARDADLEATEVLIFGATEQEVSFEIDAASQGEEGCQMVQRALAEGRPYSMAFVDFRMPPGWDGIETTKRIWAVCPDTQIVICTAYADCNWSEVLGTVKLADRLLILKKPFDIIEIVQLAGTLTEKWRLLQETRSHLDNLDQLVRQRTYDLEESRIAAMSMMEEAVRNREKEKQISDDLRGELERHKRLEEQLRERASLLDMAGNAILMWGLDHNVTYWNKGAERLYGWTSAESIGHSIAGLMRRDPKVFEDACRQVLLTGEWVGQLPQIAKSGDEFIIKGHWTLVRSADGKPKSILAINERA